METAHRKTPEEAENTENTLHVPNEETAAPTSADRTVEEARQGHTGDHVRYILLASFGGIVLLFAILYAFFAA